MADSDNPVKNNPNVPDNETDWDFSLILKVLTSEYAELRQLLDPPWFNFVAGTTDKPKSGPAGDYYYTAFGKQYYQANLNPGVIVDLTHNAQLSNEIVQGIYKGNRNKFVVQPFADVAKLVEDLHAYFDGTAGRYEAWAKDLNTGGSDFQGKAAAVIQERMEQYGDALRDWQKQLDGHGLSVSAALRQAHSAAVTMGQVLAYAWGWAYEPHLPTANFGNVNERIHQVSDSIMTGLTNAGLILGTPQYQLDKIWQEKLWEDTTSTSSVQDAQDAVDAYITNALRALPIGPPINKPVDLMSAGGWATINETITGELRNVLDALDKAARTAFQPYNDAVVTLGKALKPLTKPAPGTPPGAGNQPNLNTPNPNYPNINFPNINYPNINYPNLNTPNLNTPNPNAGNPNLPNLNTPNPNEANPNLYNIPTGPPGGGGAGNPNLPGDPGTAGSGAGLGDSGPGSDVGAAGAGAGLGDSGPGSDAGTAGAGAGLGDSGPGAEDAVLGSTPGADGAGSGAGLDGSVPGAEDAGSGSVPGADGTGSGAGPDASMPDGAAGGADSNGAGAPGDGGSSGIPGGVVPGLGSGGAGSSPGDGKTNPNTAIPGLNDIDPGAGLPGAGDLGDPGSGLGGGLGAGPGVPGDSGGLGAGGVPTLPETSIPGGGAGGGDLGLGGLPGGGGAGGVPATASAGSGLASPDGSGFGPGSGATSTPGADGLVPDSAKLSGGEAPNLSGAGGSGASGLGSGMMPPMMPPGAGAGQGQGKKERERQTWLNEDEKVWGVDVEVGFGVIGRPEEDEDEYEYEEAVVPRRPGRGSVATRPTDPRTPGTGEQETTGETTAGHQG